VDEAEWLACGDPAAMLTNLRQGGGKGSAPGSWVPHPSATKRKVRLFVAAGLPVVLPETTLVPRVEAMADDPSMPPDRRWWPTDEDVWDAASCVVTASHRGGRLGALACLWRDVIGNPFRPPPPVRAFGGLMRVGWLTPAVLGMAARAYAENDFSPAALGVLADALEDAGCRDADVLRHLRGWERCPDCLDPYDGARVYCDGCPGTGWVPAGPPCPACGGRGWHPGDVGCGACGATTPGTVGTGRLPAVHAKGCWVLDLVLGRDQGGAPCVPSA
jgi:hypothetical protein